MARKSVSPIVKAIENTGHYVEAWRVRDYYVRLGHSKQETIEHFTSGNIRPRNKSRLERSVEKALKSNDQNKVDFAKNFMNKPEYKATMKAFYEGKTFTKRGLQNLNSDIDTVAAFYDNKNQDIKQRLLKSYRIHLQDYLSNNVWNKIEEKFDELSYYDFAKLPINELFSLLQQLGTSEGIIFDKPSESILRYSLDVLDIDYNMSDLDI